MRYHIIEGEAGCRYAVENQCTAIVVDALRASATAAMLLHHGALEILTVAEVDEALAAKAALPDALLYGERGGLPPEGFDYGNSPREAHFAHGHRVIFTTTTGAGRMLQAWGAPAVFMGSTVNAAAVVRAANSQQRDVVIIPAGLMGNPDFDAQEDRVAAVAIVMEAEASLGEGADIFAHWRPGIEAEGLDALFQGAPHAHNLRQIGLPEDITYCAQLNITQAVPSAVERTEHGVVLRLHADAVDAQDIRSFSAAPS